MTAIREPFHLLLVLLLAVFVTACAKLPTHPALSSWQRLGSGLVFELLQPVTIPPGQSSVFIQNGEVSAAGRSRLASFCELGIDRIAETPVTIRPGRFRIERVKGQTLYVAAPVHFASLTGFVQWASAGGEDTLPPDVTEAWRMRLSSPSQPQVVLLLCGGEEDNPAAVAEPPTLEQIQSALGAIGRLRPVES